MTVPLCISITVLSSVGVPVLISLSITVCLSVCLSVSWSICRRILLPSLYLYCYLYVFISVSLSPVCLYLQFFSLSVPLYLSVTAFVWFLYVIFPASPGSAHGSNHGCSYSPSRDHSRPILV